MIFLALLLGILPCSAQELAVPPTATDALSANQDSNQGPAAQGTPPELKLLLSQMSQDMQDAAIWRREVLRLLSQLVQEQREVSSGQADMARLLGVLGGQGSQHLTDLQNLARHQSLLVENHQALLLQVSRVVTHLQDMAKNKPNSQSATVNQ